MIHSSKAQRLNGWLVLGWLICTSLAFSNCSGSKKESTEATATSDSSVFGRMGDTMNSSLNAPQQAPPDSADAGGAVVPAEVEVKAKK